MSERHDELPVADYDFLSAGNLAHRIRALSPAELDVLIDYERRHSGRRAVIELLTGRRRQLTAGASVDRS